MEAEVLYEVLPGAVARIWLNRAERRNAQNTALLYALNDAFDRAAWDPAVKVVILAAKGPHFSSGHDLSETDAMERWPDHRRVGSWELSGAGGAEPMLVREQELYLGFARRWRELPKPTIAQVQGKCIAGGLMLAWPCDLIVAADDALFQDNTVAMGIGGVEWLAHPWELGVRRAKEMLFTADWLGAEEARALGMVSRVAPVAELEDATLALARQIAEKPLFALRAAKQAINAMEDAQGRRAAEELGFAYHQLAHAHNQLAHGAPIDPAYLRRFSRGAKDDPT